MLHFHEQGCCSDIFKIFKLLILQKNKNVKFKTKSKYTQIHQKNLWSWSINHVYEWDENLRCVKIKIWNTKFAKIDHKQCIDHTHSMN